MSEALIAPLQDSVAVQRNPIRAFSEPVRQALRHYVYRYVDPVTNETFYIGKGQNDRVFAHLFDAEFVERSGPKVERIRQIWSLGKDVRIVIHRHGLETDREAALVEAALIDCFPNSHNEMDGLGSVEGGAQLVSDLISKYSAEPAVITFNAVIIKINAEWAKRRSNRWSEVDPVQLYDSTRAAWALNPFAHRHTRHAIAVSFGIIRQIYRIDRWLPADRDASGNRIDNPDRWLFEGVVAEDKADLKGKVVTGYQSAQNPIRWVEFSDQVTGEPVEILGNVIRRRKKRPDSRLERRAQELEKYHA